ncbi:MAG: hypothetical protein WCI51_23215 [Lentisphaerota bacterium]
MPPIEKNQLLELEILKHVETTPILNNRLAAAKLGCSVKLSHELLKKMVSKGLLHVTKLHSRRWDYFLTPKGLAEKARITREFLSFSKYFYHEARKASSMLCRRLHEQGVRRIAIIGIGDLAEIVYLGVKEWGLELTEVFDNRQGEFFGIQAQPFAATDNSRSEALIICVYDENFPMVGPKLPEGIKKSSRLYWLFDEKYYEQA